MPRIIIADDEATVVRIMRRALEQAGYAVETARNGLEALDAISRQDPDVLMTDIEMPRMTGQQLCQTLHQQRPDRRFPIFVITSLTALEHRDWSEQIPNLFFLEKPVSIRRLTARLEEYFQPSVGETQRG